MCTKWEGAHLQYVNNDHAKFEYKEMKTVGVTDYTKQIPPTHSDGTMSKFNTCQK